MGKQLALRFEYLRSLYFNPNTKGSGYENVLKRLLNEYLGGVVTLHTRCFLIDRDQHLLRLLQHGKNEFDVVATFNSACPRIVLREGVIRYVPFDAIAFMIQVKQTLTKPNLEKDLEKFEKVSQADTSKRFDVKITGDYSVDYPIRVLAYYEKQIDAKEFRELIEKKPKNWDLIILVKDDQLYYNTELPFAQKVMGGKMVKPFHPHALCWLLLILSLSFTIPPVVNTAQTFLNLWKTYYGRNDSEERPKRN